MQIISSFSGPPSPPKDDQGERLIPSQHPIYEKEKTIEIALRDQCLALSRSSSRDLQNLELTNENLLEIIVKNFEDKKSHRYIRSEWCTYYNHWAASDSFVLNKVESDDYYFKYFIHKNNKVLIHTISFHLPRL